MSEEFDLEEFREKMIEERGGIMNIYNDFIEETVNEVERRSKALKIGDLRKHFFKDVALKLLEKIKESDCK